MLSSTLVEFSLEFSRASPSQRSRYQTLVNAVRALLAPPKAQVPAGNSPTVPPPSASASHHTTAATSDHQGVPSGQITPLASIDRDERQWRPRQSVLRLGRTAAALRHRGRAVCSMCPEGQAAFPPDLVISRCRCAAFRACDCRTKTRRTHENPRRAAPPFASLLDQTSCTRHHQKVRQTPP